MNRRDRFGQVGLQTRHLIAVRQNPCASADSQVKGPPSYYDRDHGAASIALLEAELPCRLAVPLSETFARHREIRSVLGVENQHQSGGSLRGDMVGKLFLSGAAPSVFVDVHESARSSR